MSTRASLTSTLARMYESTLDSAGASAKGANRSSSTGGNNLTAMDKKLNLLNEKVDKILNFHEDVMEKLDSVHQGIDGIEKGIDKLTTLPAPDNPRAPERGGRYIDDIYYSHLRDICSEILKLMTSVHQDASKQREALEGVEKMVSTVDKVVTFMGETFKNSNVVDFILKGIIPWKRGSLAEIHHETKEKPEEKGAKPKHGLSTRGIQAEIRGNVEETKKGKRADENIGKCEKVTFGGAPFLNVDCDPPAEERLSVPQTVGTSDKLKRAKTYQQQEDVRIQGKEIVRPCAKSDHGRKQELTRDANHAATTLQKMRLEEYSPKKHVCGKSGDTERVTLAPSSGTTEAVPAASRSATHCDLLCPSLSSTLQKVDTQETIPVTKERALFDLPDKGSKERSAPRASLEAEGTGHFPGKFKHAQCHKDARTETAQEANKVQSESKPDPPTPKAGQVLMRCHTSATEGSLTEQVVHKCKNRPGTAEKEQKKEPVSLATSCDNQPSAGKEVYGEVKGQTSELDMVHTCTGETHPTQCPGEPQDGTRREGTERAAGAQDGLVVDDSPPPPAPFGHRIVSVKQVPLTTCYSVCQDEVLGGGRFGQVHRCAETSSGLTLAAKIIKVKSAKDREEVKNEINVMNQLSHANLIQLYDAFESKNSFTLIMEYVDGGELFDRIADENYSLTELDAILFTKQICEGVYYLHQQYILHLDLKPENILCVSHTGNQIKIIDFGLARRYKPREKLKVNFGTPEFLAPEVVNYDFVSFPTDMWSIGVITYMLLSGLSPFLGENDTETMNYIVNCNWDFNAEAFEQVSDEARDFISQLLVKEKSCRISAAQCLKHDWLIDLPAKAKKSKVRLKSQVQLQRYLVQRKWKKHFYAVAAANRLRKLQRMSLNLA